MLHLVRTVMKGKHTSKLSGNFKLWVDCVKSFQSCHLVSSIDDNRDMQITDYVDAVDSEKKDY